MANPYYATYTLAGNIPGPQAPVNMDYLIAPFTTTVAVWSTASGSNLSYAVEWTADDILNNDPTTARWFADPALTYWQTASGFTFIQYPVRWLRINLDVFEAPVELKIIQGFSIN